MKRHYCKVFFILISIAPIALAMISTASAAPVTAQSVSENFAPPRILNGACSTNVGDTSNGSTANNDGYCPRDDTPSNYSITYTFNRAMDENMSSIIIWANAGSIYGDGELRTFDLEVDYVDNAGSPATLTMNGVNIGDTLNNSDSKTVTFLQSGSPVALRAVSQLRISNLGGVPRSFAFRELVGDVVQEVPNPDFTMTKSASPSANVPAGGTVTYTYTVTNTGNQPISNVQITDTHNASGPAPAPVNETLSTDSGTLGDSTDGTANDGVWDDLAPFDAVTFTATYTVTQNDVENLQ